MLRSIGTTESRNSDISLAQLLIKTAWKLSPYRSPWQTPEAIAYMFFRTDASSIPTTSFDTLVLRILDEIDSASSFAFSKSLLAAVRKESLSSATSSAWQGPERTPIFSLGILKLSARYSLITILSFGMIPFNAETINLSLKVLFHILLKYCFT